MTLPSPTVSVIIPNWNGFELLRHCLDSLRAQEYRDFETIVVDNASSDGSQEALQREYPEVTVLSLPANVGFAGGCNAGFRAARGELVSTLNNDTEADRGWLGCIVRTMDAHPEAGSVASRLMLFDRPTTLHSAGDIYGRNGLPDSRGVWQAYGPPFDREQYVFSCCGGAATYRRSMLEDVGSFEERFFMYCEDVDLGWRAQTAGWKCVYAPDAVVYHHLSATGGGSLANYYVGRNTLWVLARNYPWTLAKRHWHRIAAAQLATARNSLRALRTQPARARLRGQVVGLLTSARWLAARRRMQNCSRVTSEHIESILD